MSKKKSKTVIEVSEETTRLIKNLKKWPKKAKAPASYSKRENFVNRELSWLEFNERVLLEARDRKNPLMERLSFLSITQSNLDEFFMVRVASLRDQFNVDYSKTDISGLLPGEQLEAISECAHAMMYRMYTTYNRQILPRLKREGFFIRNVSELDDRQREIIDDYFDTTLYPILTPMAVDSGRPFPLIHNKVINLGLMLRRAGDEEGEIQFSTIQMPTVVPRIFVLTPERTANGNDRKSGDPLLEVVLLEDIVAANLHKLFDGYDILDQVDYRIMRNADLEIDEEEAADLLVEIEKQIRLRDWGEVIKLEINDIVSPELLDFLVTELEVDHSSIYSINGPLDLTFLSKLRGLPHCKQQKQLYYPAFSPQPVSLYQKRIAEAKEQGINETDIFTAIRQGDIFMYHPYEKFDPVLEFIRRAARDPDVLAIKQTLYRISSDSPIIQYLTEAARNGKQVFVLVELKARFDEENNIHWARALEKEGCHVIYGLVGLKTHSKITLVVRKEEEGIRRYVHLGTGNYNDQTAKLYTDSAIFTCRESYGEDATEFFNMLSGFSAPDDWYKLVVAPRWLRRTFVALIQRETRLAEAGKKARIVAKMNSLVDEGITKELYKASQAGVKIELIVRGICCLRPGIKGLSENITVRSLVGRYLEHARIYYFENDGHQDVFMSSADWMPRNLDRRIELLYPVEDKECKARAMEILRIQLEDNLRAHLGNPDGTYRKPDLRGVQSLDAQIASSELAIQRAELARQAEDALLIMGDFQPKFEEIDPHAPDMINVSYNSN
ncbi:MAG TPA: RNA degradosome polyphosphate kinase [Clostridiaceae bacterium]|nr:RNA degradosome polyphosphate kinase [Clostridiaceae bacterium]